MKNVFSSSAVLLSVTAALAGCATSTPRPLVAQVQAGPGNQVRPQKVLALSAACGSAEFRCPREYVATVDAIVRSTMDFAGYQLVSPDTLRTETRDRHETHVREETTEESHARYKNEKPLDFDDTSTVDSKTRTTKTTSVIELDGSGFSDLTVPERRAVLAEAGADAVLTTRVVVGAEVGNWNPDQRVEVMVKLSVDGGETMAWASRCSASSNEFSTVTGALENATRCAIHGATNR